MRALTIKQPWAWSIVHGGKRVENRSRPTSYRGPLAIHAGLKVDDWALEHDPTVRKAIRSWRAEHPGTGLTMPAGAIVAVAELTDCHEDDHCHRPWGEPLINHLVLTGVAPLATPIPLRGQLGLFRLPAELERDLTAAYLATRSPGPAVP